MEPDRQAEARYKGRHKKTRRAVMISYSSILAAYLSRKSFVVGLVTTKRLMASLQLASKSILNSFLSTLKKFSLVFSV